MKSFEELYYEVLVRTLLDKDNSFLEKMELYDTHQLDCLLNPKKYAPIWYFGNCDCDPQEHKCVKVCPFHALYPGESGTIEVDEAKCTGCSICVQECRAQHLTSSKDVIAALQAIRTHKGLVYALIAPAYLGQFNNVTPGKLRTALKEIGFDGMIEVSLFADILTLKEALEFDVNIRTETDYQLTSCCCPVWIALIRKVYHDLIPHVPPAVSPMIASGRAVKVLHPDALTIFIGPCMAKKSEAREKDIADAVDFVLTFQEVKDIFEIMKIDPALAEESEKDHSSRAGRIYAHTGGVSEAVQLTLQKLSPNRRITLKSQQADGVPACRAMINDIMAGKASANFFEGMGCVGGCVGGPKVLIPHEQGRANAEEYGSLAPYATPIDNPYVIELLHRLGFDTVEQLLEKSDLFTRSFD